MGIRIVPVGPGNWRAVTALEVEREQEAFAGPASRYLALTSYGEQGWAPLALVAGPTVVGFAMWAHDPADDAFWIGGLIVDRRHQRRGHGRAAMEALIAMARATGAPSVKLSFEPENSVARRLYARLGFRETGELVDGEVVAALDLTG